MKLDLASGAKVTLGADVAMNHHDIAVLVNQEMVGRAHMEATPGAWDSLMARFSGCDVRVVYEAGPDGFWLCRHLRAHGVTCKVVAPSMVPVEPGLRKRKNNRRDAARLGALYQGLQALTIPTPEQEADRQLVRVREQLVNQRNRLQAEILSLLRFAGQPLRESPEAATCWGPRRMAYLKSLALDCPTRARALRLLVGSLEDVRRRVKEAEVAIRDLAQDDRYRDIVRRFTVIQGVNLITAMVFIVEIFDPGRFPSQAELAAYLGFVPQENSTGDTLRRGRILRSGNKHLRRVLIQAAWVWQRYDATAKQALQRFYRNHGNQKGVKQKAAVYLARKLAAILWAMWRDESDYRKAEEPKSPEPIAKQQAAA
jgi:transposase